MWSKASVSLHGEGVGKVNGVEMKTRSEHQEINDIDADRLIQRSYSDSGCPDSLDKPNIDHIGKIYGTLFKTLTWG